MMANKGLKNPYVGLRPFEMDESLLFFGRSEQTLELLQRLHQHSFVAVVGSSGSGKSSLLRAGLIPALMGGFLVENSDKWMIAIMKPGQRPLYNLAEAILNQIKKDTPPKEVAKLVKAMEAQGAAAILDLVSGLREKDNFNFFLLIDQFEELFRFAMDTEDVDKKNEAIEFVDTFLELVSQNSTPFYVVLTMRSDFIGDCAQFHGLPEAMNKSQYLVPRLSREQLKKVIEGPAKLYGGSFDSALTSRLLNHIGNVTDELPVLQHTLMRMWDYETNLNKSGTIDLVDYKGIGGVTKALSNHADEALNELNDRERNLAEQIFKSLTEIDDYGRKIRRPARLSVLKELTGANEKTLLDVIDHFIRDNRSFLIVQNIGDSDDKLIDISHESLIRQWKLLEDWVEEEDENAKIYAKLVNAKKEYDSESKGLLDDLELQNFVEWRDRFNIKPTWASRYGSDFEACMGFLSDSEKAQLERKKNERRRLTRMKVFMGTSLVLLVACLVIGIFYVKAEADQLKEDKASRLHESAQQLIKTDPTRALMLEMAACKILKNKKFDSIRQKYKDSADAIYNGSNSFYKILKKIEPFPWSFIQDDQIWESYVSPSNDYAAVVYKSGNVLMFDKEKNTVPLRTIEAVASTTTDAQEIIPGQTSLEDAKAAAGKATRNPKSKPNPISAHAYSENGSAFAMGEKNGRITVWEAETGKVREIQDSIGASQSISSIAFSPDGQRIASGAANGRVTVWGLDGKKLRVYDVSAQSKTPVTLVSFAAYDNVLFGSSFLNSAVIYETEEVELRNESSAYGDYDQSGLIYTVAFDSINNYIVTGGEDRKVRVWDRRGRFSYFMEGHTREINFVDFLYFKNNTYVVSADMGNNIILWDINGTPLQQFVGHQDAITAVSLSEDGNFIVSTSKDLTTRQWPLSNPVKAILYHDPFEYVLDVVFTNNGKNILTASDGYSIKQWDLNGNEERELLKDDTNENEKEILYLLFSDDGAYSFMVSDGVMSIRDNNTDTNIYTYENEPIVNAKFSKDSSKLAFILESGEVVLQDIRSEKFDTIISKTPEIGIISSLDFSSDSQSMLLGTRTGKILLIGLDGSILKTIDIGEKQILTGLISPDGKNILVEFNEIDALSNVERYDNPAQIVQLYTIEGTRVPGFETTTVIPGTMAFSPDGNYFATNSYYDTMIWDMSGNLMNVFFRHSNMISLLTYAPDGKLIATGSVEGNVFVWDPAPRKTVEEFIESGTIETLSEEIKKEFGIDE